MTGPIFLLTDFGLTDTYVGIVKAVILSIAPDAHLVDLTHDIPPQDIRAGAYALLTATPYLPADGVVLAVVDPGVGTGRRPVAVQAGRFTFVGPDNGLLSWAIARAASLDGGHAGETHPPPPATAGAVRVVVLDQPRYWLPNVSATFHGRDIFGPVAAHIANGVQLAALGTPASAMEHLPFPRVRCVTGADGQVREVHGAVIHVDRYGNLVTNITAADMLPAPFVEVADARIHGLSSTYQAGGGPLLALVGSAGFLEVAAPNGSAAAVTGASVGVPVVVRRGPVAPT